MGRLLGIDPGQRWVGIALSDPQKVIATPHRVVDRRNQDLSEVLAEILQNYQVDTILVGYPKPLRTTVNQRTRQVDQFIEQFISPFDISYHRVSERYTTNQALTISKTQSANSRADALAAALIIEHYIKSTLT